MFEYVCEHIVPGCGHVDRDESQEKLLKRVAVHLREHHDLDHRDDRVSQTLKQTGIVYFPPA